MPPTPGLPLTSVSDHGAARSKGKPNTSMPISSGAFNFNLGLLSSKAEQPTPALVKQIEHTPHRSTVPPRLQTLSRKTSTPTRTTKKDVKPLHALPSPISFSLDSPSPVPALSTPRKRLTAVLDEGSPFTTTPARSRSEAGGEEKRVRLGDIPTAPGTVGFVKLEARKEEEDGVGVSPRKSKTIKWSGKGPPPPSSQLDSVLKSAHSSMSLFYSSLHRTLQPTHSKKSQAADLFKVPTPLEHLHSASLILRPTSLFQGRTHQGIMMWCTAKRVNGPGPATKAADDEETRVLLVLHPLPSDCPRLGTDPRVVCNNMGDGSKKWRCGVWEPFIETRIPFPSRSATEFNSGRDRDDPEDGKIEKKEKSTTTVIFASRYLFAQAEYLEL